MGSHIFGIMLVSRDLNKGRFMVKKMVRAVVLKFSSRLALKSVHEIAT